MTRSIHASLNHQFRHVVLLIPICAPLSDGAADDIDAQLAEEEDGPEKGDRGEAHVGAHPRLWLPLAAVHLLPLRVDALPHALRTQLCSGIAFFIPVIKPYKIPFIISKFKVPLSPYKRKVPRRW